MKSVCFFLRAVRTECAKPTKYKPSASLSKTTCMAGIIAHGLRPPRCAIIRGRIMSSTDIYLGVIQFIVLLFSLSVHESAHAWTADALGDPTARYLGRVSLNPIVHADLMGTIIFPLIGIFALGGAMFGWAKPVPVNVARLRHSTRDHMIVAAAGPISNLMVATILFTLLMLMKSFSSGGAAMIYRVAANDIS